MVIGLISSLPTHVNLITEMILQHHSFTHITERDIVSTMGIGKLVNTNKAPLLDALHDTYGNVIVSGDTFWSEALCQHLLTNLHGVLLVDITLPKSDDLPHIHYWGYEGILDWIVQLQSNRVPQHDGGTVVYLDVDSSQFQFNMVTLLNTIQNQYEKRDVKEMSMEDVIQRAMEDLGIEPSVAKNTEPPVAKSTEPPVAKNTEPSVAKSTEPPVAKNTEPSVAKSTEPPVAKNTEPSVAKNTEPPVAKSTEPSVAKSTEPPVTISTSTNSQIYLKIKDGTLALFIPTNIELPKQVISSVEYHTLVFTAPDLGNTGLQPLKVHNAIVSLKEKQPPTSAVDVTDLQQLLAQKVHLDQSIKNARAANDETTVNELRHQRRLIRRQINKWGIKTVYNVE